MASLRRLPDTKNWIACFTDSAGRRLQRSTGTRKRKEAMLVAWKFEEAARKLKTETQIRRVISDLFQSIAGEPLPSGTIEEFFRDWTERKHSENADRTAERYASVAQQFLTDLGDKAKLDLNYLSAKDVLSFRDKLLKRVAPSTVNQHVKILRVALNQAKREGLIQTNPAAQVMRVKLAGDEVERRAFTLPELKQILRVATDEWRGMIAFGLYTGQRLGDIARLTWNNIDTERQEIRFAAAKTKRRIVLPIAAPLFDYLTNLPAAEDATQPLFPKLAARLRSSNRAGTLSNQFYDILVAAGLAPLRSHRGTGKGRGSRRARSQISYHSLRHTVTSLLKAAGVSDAVAREFVGHESAAISQHYTHIETAALRRAAEKLPNIFATKVRPRFVPRENA
jgi:integrase